MFKKSALIVSGLLLSLSALTACGNASGDTNAAATDTKAESKHEPITLTFGNHQGGYKEGTGSNFDEIIKKPIETKFPFITVVSMDTTKDADLQAAVASGTGPDIISGGSRGMDGLNNMGLPEDLTPYIKKYNLDLNNYVATGVDTIKDYTKGSDKMLALPIVNSFYVTLYNKDIFNKFAVAYPPDNMSWDDVKKLAEKLTREADGVQYKGVLPGNVTLLARGQSLSFVDPATNKAAINNDKWKNLFEFALSMYKIPGNMPKNTKQLYNLDEFYKDKVLAMLPYYSTSITTIASTDNVGFDWDMTSYPSFEPGKSAEIDTTIMVVSSASKHKDEAFQAIQYLTTSKELQSEFAKSGQLPALKLSNFEELYGSNYPILKQKNVKGVLNVETRSPHPFNKYDDIVRSKVDNIFINQYLTGKMDTNTALRTIEEQANKTIEAQ